MLHLPNLLNDRLNQLRDCTWYRQRFDACPHFMFFLGDAHISEIQHTSYPFGQRIAYAGFSKNRADWYHAMPELEYTTQHILALAQQDPHISKKMIAEFLPWQEAFYAACLPLDTTDLRALSNDELLRVYQELASIYTKKLNASPLIDGFALSTDTLIAGKIKDFLEEKKLGDDFVRTFAILTAPTFVSFLQEEEIALLNLAVTVERHPEQRDELLRQHQAAYFWMSNNYVKDYVVSVEQFTQRLAALSGTDVQERIRELRALPEIHAHEKQELIAALQLPEEIRTLLRITDDFNAWQDERKKGTFWATHYFSQLLEEFARRTHYTVEELKYAFPPEMPQVLSQSIEKQELQARFSYCMILWVKDAYDVTTDQAFIDELDRIGTGKFSHDVELKGFTAQLGCVRGVARILQSAEEMEKIRSGEILVAVMTRPDYIPAMKKAAAFVTDEGGITCHAAIVAREMKKPCIIGTKIATKVLKDGDLVEVDADRGIVKILKR